MHLCHAGDRDSLAPLSVTVVTLVAVMGIAAVRPCQSCADSNRSTWDGLWGTSGAAPHLLLQGRLGKDQQWLWFVGVSAGGANPSPAEGSINWMIGALVWLCVG